MTQNFTKELRIFLKENHDCCTKCGYEFQYSDTTHLGYDSNHEYAYLCDKCSYLLAETVVRHFFEKRKYQIPNTKSKLWRYMDFSKYVFLLSKRGLFFSSASNFDDVFEGAKGIIQRKEKWDEYYMDFFKSAIKNPPPGYICEKTSEEIDHEAERLLEDLSSSGEKSRERVFINCWHENFVESEAMWKLYSKDITNAICIQTTYESLYFALGRNPAISIGRVNYINFSNHYAPINDSYWYKRKAFEHEKEVRAIINSREKSCGLIVPIDIDLLLNNIYISPSAPEWFVDVVKEINEKYKVMAPVLQSTLNEKPFY